MKEGGDYDRVAQGKFTWLGGTGTFKTIPTCKSASQTGCVIAYATFRDTVPPPADSRFGRVQEPGMEAVCVNVEVK